MEAFGSGVVYPTIEQIIDVNRQMIKTSGGSFTPPDNFHNRNSLEYILDAIANPIFKQFLYPSLLEKAAALAYEIISCHVFLDGNKRTGIHIAWEFLRSNNMPIFLDSTIENLAINLANGTATRDDLLLWLRDNQMDFRTIA